MNYAKKKSMEKGELYECKFVKQFGGMKRVTDLNKQFADIDVEHKSGRTFSIKNVIDGCKAAIKSGRFKPGILIEVLQEDTRTQETMKGWWKLSEADAMCFAIFHEDKEQWLFISKEQTQQVLDQQRYKLIGTNPATQALCRSQGRKYDKAYNYIIPIEDVLQWPVDTFKLMPIEG